VNDDAESVDSQDAYLPENSPESEGEDTNAGEEEAEESHTKSKKKPNKPGRHTITAL